MRRNARLASTRRGAGRRLSAPLAVAVAVAVATTVALSGCLSSATAGTASSSSVSPVSGFGSNWTSYHGNAEATGVPAAQTKLRSSRPAWTSPTLDGQLYGEPLVADGRVVAATENNTVYVMAGGQGLE
jgi:polyvinyl alcohol dehydrogenase (cytochrome)